MSLPREGARDTGEGILVSIYPDVCLTPCGNTMVPVPYTLWAKQEDDANTTPTVRMTSLRTHNMGSLITTCHGDEAGTGGGVKSGTHNGICEPLEHSGNVRAEGKNSIRHNDIWWMNNRNTQGKLLWIKDSDRQDLTPHSQEGWEAKAKPQQFAQAATGTMTDASSAAAIALPAAEGAAARAAPGLFARTIAGLGLTAGEAAVAGVGAGTSEIGVGDVILAGLLIYLIAKGRTAENVNVSSRPKERKCSNRIVQVSSSKYPESAQHIVDAQAAGKPSVVTIDRPGADARRAIATGAFPRVAGKQPDEYPPAMFMEGGANASVKNISASDNMGSGASIGNQLRGEPDGCKATIMVVP